LADHRLHRHCAVAPRPRAPGPARSGAPGAFRCRRRPRTQQQREGPALSDAPAFGALPAAVDAALTVLAPGASTTVQDLGRPGRGALGVGRSGAADRGAMAAANRLVGNPEGAPVLETTLGGLELRARRPLAMAVAGPAATVTVDGVPVGTHSRVHLDAGRILAVGAPDHGLRHYVAVRGGVAGVRGGDGAFHGPELGSLSADAMSRLGPPPLDRGDLVFTGRPAAALPGTELNPRRRDGAMPTAAVRLPIVWGPRDDWFTPGARRLLVSQRWTVTADTDRVGARLQGREQLTRARGDELASEPMVVGALQVPPDGR